MRVNYEDILNEGWGDLPEDPLLPGGTWRLKCRGAKYKAGQGDEAKPQVTFTLEAQEPMDNVDTGALAVFGEDQDYSARPVFVRIYVERRSDWRKVATILKALGVDPEAYDTKPAALKSAKGKECLAWIGTRTFVRQNGEPGEENTASNFEQVK